jgi:predicted AAA+ superfamily ATPase
MRNMALNRFFDFKDREDQGQLIENYVFKRLTDLYDKDAMRYWRTTDKKEIDFIISTSFKEGLAYEVKAKCPSFNQDTQKRFTENYPGYQLQVISYSINAKCKWILKL